MSTSSAISGRLASLDVLRGLVMLFIMGGGVLVRKLCVLFGWTADCAMAQQFVHAPWHGLRFYDCIFPVFLFVAGVSFPYSLAKQLSAGRSRGKVAVRCLRRAAILFLLGLAYGGCLFSFRFASLTLGSVLGRIGIAWCVAAWLFLFMSRRARVAVAVGILLGYWLLLLWVPAPDAAQVVVPERLLAFEGGPFSPSSNLAGYVDRQFLPLRMTVPGVISNQGILSTLPAVVTAMLGMFAGEFLRGRGQEMSGARRSAVLFGAGAALIVCGSAVAFGFGRWSMPFNKILWSSSFTLAVGGGSACALAVFHYVVDVRRLSTWAFPLTVIGLNSLTIYLAQAFVDFNRISAFFFGGLASLCPAAGAECVLAAGYLLACWVFLFALYRRGVFFRV